MKKKYLILITLLMVTMLLAGCGLEGKLDEGDCPVEVRLSGLPTGYAELTDDQKEQIEVTLLLENSINEKLYTFRLSADNHFSQDASLIPGSYRVISCDISGNSAVVMEGEASVESMDINRETINIISVNVTNEEEYNLWAAQMRVEPSVLRAEQFSRVIQFEGQVIGIDEITDYVEFDYERQIRADDEIELGNDEKGVYVTLLNDTDESTTWQNCKVIGVRFTKDNVIFSKGARINMRAEEALHEKDGLYRTPDELSGCVLIGAGYNDFDAIYHDTVSGDRMTVTVDSSGEYISEIAYELEVFEYYGGKNR